MRVTVGGSPPLERLAVARKAVAGVNSNVYAVDQGTAPGAGKGLGATHLFGPGGAAAAAGVTTTVESVGANAGHLKICVPMCEPEASARKVIYQLGAMGFVEAVRTQAARRAANPLGSLLAEQMGERISDALVHATCLDFLFLTQQAAKNGWQANEQPPPTWGDCFDVADRVSMFASYGAPPTALDAAAGSGDASGSGGGGGGGTGESKLPEGSTVTIRAAKPGEEFYAASTQAIEPLGTRQAILAEHARRQAMLSMPVNGRPDVFMQVASAVADPILGGANRAIILSKKTFVGNMGGSDGKGDVAANPIHLRNEMVEVVTRYVEECCGVELTAQDRGGMASFVDDLTIGHLVYEKVVKYLGATAGMEDEQGGTVGTWGTTCAPRRTRAHSAAPCEHVQHPTHGHSACVSPSWVGAGASRAHGRAAARGPSRPPISSAP